MTLSPYRLLTLAFLPAFVCASAQQPAGKPVLSATPPAVTATVIAPAPGTGTADPSYIIGPDDSIQITVWKEPTFSEGVLVRPDGMITIPAIGDVQASGRTPMQLAADITVLLKKLVIDPLVSVSVLTVNSKRVFLLGEVSHVGPLTITPGMTILQALASSGGLTPYAHRNKIYILRGEPGKQQKLFFDYNKAIKTGNMQGVSLIPGDTIVVP